MHRYTRCMERSFCCCCHLFSPSPCRPARPARPPNRTRSVGDGRNLHLRTSIRLHMENINNICELFGSKNIIHRVVPPLFSGRSSASPTSTVQWTVLVPLLLYSLNATCRLRFPVGITSKHGSIQQNNINKKTDVWGTFTSRCFAC